MKKDKLLTGAIILVVLFILVASGFHSHRLEAKEVFKVYLNGEILGLIDDKDELLNMINEEQQDIKNEYQVDNVYPPNGFSVEPFITYDENIIPAQSVYEKIQSKGDFTILGYEIAIKAPATNDTEEKVTYIYVLDDQVYKDAEYRYVTTFVEEADYINYMNNTQEEIKDVGSFIKHMEISETRTIKRTYIPAKEKIFTDSLELTQYLLYSTTEPTSKYIVKQGDTLASIANASKLNVRELLIANPKYRSTNAVLAIGDEVSNSLINPIINLVEEVRITEDVEQAFNKVTVRDENMRVGASVVAQQGITGIERITQEVRILNGERAQDANVVSSVTIRAAQDEITKVGPTYVNPTIISGGYAGRVSTGLSWSWPTNRPYIITTDYEYRWGSFHDAIDISGTGRGSPIYAARGGTVTDVFAQCANDGWLGSMCGSGYGNYVVIAHENNYHTLYAHILSSIPVSVGQTVSQGQVIGYMGNSGSSTGTHLHFAFAIGNPVHGGTSYSPWSLY